MESSPVELSPIQARLCLAIETIGANAPSAQIKMLIGGFLKHIKKSMFTDADVVSTMTWISGLCDYVLDGATADTTAESAMGVITSGLPTDTDRSEGEGSGDPSGSVGDGEVDPCGVLDQSVPRHVSG